MSNEEQTQAPKKLAEQALEELRAVRENLIATIEQQVQELEAQTVANAAAFEVHEAAKKVSIAQ